MKAVNIMWDTDGDKKLFEELPSEVEIPDDVDEEDIGDYISDLRQHRTMPPINSHKSS